MGGLVLDTLDHEEGLSQWVNYAQSKVGCYFLSVEMASRMRDHGVINLVRISMNRRGESFN